MAKKRSKTRSARRRDSLTQTTMFRADTPAKILDRSLKLLRNPRKPIVNTINRPVKPMSTARRDYKNAVREIFKEKVHKPHDCKKEYKKILSWRSAQSSGGTKRHRTPTELKNNQQSFLKKC